MNDESLRVRLTVPGPDVTFRSQRPITFYFIWHTFCLSASFQSDSKQIGFFLSSRHDGNLSPLMTKILVMMGKTLAANISIRYEIYWSFCAARGGGHPSLTQYAGGKKSSNVLNKTQQKIVKKFATHALLHLDLS